MKKSQRKKVFKFDSDRQAAFVCMPHTLTSADGWKLCAARRIRNLTDNAKAKTRVQCEGKALHQTKQRKKGG